MEAKHTATPRKFWATAATTTGQVVFNEYIYALSKEEAEQKAMDMMAAKGTYVPSVEVTEEPKHTATPYECRDAAGQFLDPGNWNAENDGASRTEFVPIKANSEVIALIVREDWDSPKLPATADFIVRACNAHDDLVSSLEFMTDLVRITYGNLDKEIWTEIEKANAALAKAGA